MTRDEAEKLRWLIRSYQEELVLLKKLPSDFERLLQIAKLLEKVLKRHFPIVDDAESQTDGKPKTLGKYLFSRKTFLGSRLRSESRDALKIRNRAAHEDDDEGPASEAEMQSAAVVFETIIDKHIEELIAQCEHVRSEPPGSEPPESPPPPGRGSSSSQDTGGEKPTTGQDKVGPAGKVTKEKLDEIGASPGDPELSASSVAEYAFCPRAGILTHEGGGHDPSDELPSLTLLPWYEESAIEQAYAASVLRLFWLLVGFAAGLVALSVFSLGPYLFPLLLAAGSGIWVYLAMLEYGTFRELGVRRLAAKVATECNPDSDAEEPQAVNWWGLLKAGYEVRRPEAAMRDGHAKLNGKPRRILQRDSTSLPVHRISKLEGGVKRQHIVRVMVHCYLIRATESSICDFGIVLFGNSYEGVTVPYSETNQKDFHKVLELARKAVVEAQTGEREPPAPVDRSICSGCPHGKPRPASEASKTMHYDVPLDPFLLVNSKGKLFHCDCGDRFRWKPPHIASQRLKPVD